MKITKHIFNKGVFSSGNALHYLCAFLWTFAASTLLKAQMPDRWVEDDEINWVEMQTESLDRSIGIAQYADPATHPMIGWRGMHVRLEPNFHHLGDTYYLQISNDPNQLEAAPAAPDQGFEVEADLSQIHWSGNTNQLIGGLR